MTAKADDIIAKLLAQPRQEWPRADIPASTGIYAIFLKESPPNKIPSDLNDCLQGRMKGDRLIYIGKAEDGLKTRLGKHFAGKNRGRSTFRKSLGALLKAELKLVATHTGRSPSNYFFAGEGECCLNRWIRESLEFSYYECDSADRFDLETVEVAVICRCQPPLNLDCNPSRCKHLKCLRKKCRDEAKANRVKGRG